MNIRIESTQFPLAASLNRYLHRRLTQDLAFCRERIHTIRAKITENRDTTGAIDKQCRIVVELDQGKEIAVQGTRTDLYVAIRLAADRLNKALISRVSQHDSARLARPGEVRAAA